MATSSSPLTTLRPSFRSSITSSPYMAALPRRRRPGARYPRIRAIDLDQNTIVAISVGVVSIAVGIGVPVFYETQIDNAAKRENTQPCFPCSGSGAQVCRFCSGKGVVTVVLGAGETEESQCVNCEGIGSLTCTTCQGTGIQPRYLDRRNLDAGRDILASLQYGARCPCGCCCISDVETHKQDVRMEKFFLAETVNISAANAAYLCLYDANMPIQCFWQLVCGAFSEELRTMTIF